MDVTFRRTGERLAREHLEELARSERLAGLIHRTWGRAARPLDDERLERVCACLDELSARWSGLAVGGELTVTWPETARAPHRAAPAPRRGARRPRGGRVHR
jgi:hypothetical protein